MKEEKQKFPLVFQEIFSTCFVPKTLKINRNHILEDFNQIYLTIFLQEFEDSVININDVEGVPCIQPMAS
jgi:hypothetical protein